MAKSQNILCFPMLEYLKYPSFESCAVNRASMDDSETRVDDVHELGFKRTLSIVQLRQMIMMFAASHPFSNSRFEGSQTLPNRETENYRSCRLCEVGWDVVCCWCSCCFSSIW
ncbi:uncharacterized protein [Triticum aestivum]|uniref:uncharacterized protein isoform X2 n=1 Tax=Triticum aestivum TaxID=4565 RepID=UPI001D01B585|nr:uncharacterized protein LOC123136252 isoform X2 [Triticum aestivum]